MLDRSLLSLDPPLPPQPRRRAYSDSTKSRPMFRRLASPPPIYCPLSPFNQTPLETIEAKVPLCSSPKDYYLHSLEVGSPPTKASSPISVASSSPTPGSPSLSRYAGMVVGSPLGLGPLNGQHLPSLDMSPACSMDSIPSE